MLHEIIVGGVEITSLKAGSPGQGPSPWVSCLFVVLYFSFKFIFIIYSCVCSCMCRYLWRPEEAIRSLVLELQVFGCELRDVDAGN